MDRSRRKRRLLLAAGVTLGSLAVWGLDETATDDAPAVERHGHQACRDARYRLRYTGSFTTSLPGLEAGADTALQTDTDLAAVVSTRCISSDHDGWRVAWSFENLDTLDLELMGQDALRDAAQDEAALVGPTLVVDYTAEGQVAAIAYPDDAPALFVSLARTVVGESQTPRRRGGTRWDVVESTIIGTARAHVETDGHSLTKRRAQYEQLTLGEGGGVLEPVDQTLDHLLEATLSDDGTPKEIRARETLVVRSDQGQAIETEWTLEMDRLPDARTVLTRLPNASRWRTYALDEQVMRAETRQSLDARATDGLTWKQAERFIRRFDHDRAMRDEGRTAHQLDGYLALHPEAVWDLAELAADETLSSDGRQFVVWALAQTDVALAQSALRQVLTLDIVRDDDSFLYNVQSLGHVRQPSRDTLTFARDLMQAEQGQLRLAAAHGLGGLVAHADEIGQTDQADELNALLLDELAAAHEPADRAHLLDALSNTRRPANVARIVEFSEDPSWRVRSAAARAVVRTPTAEAADMVHELIGDSSISVQREALRSIHRASELSPSHDQLADSIADSIRGPNVRRALRLLANRPSSDARDRALIAMAGATHDQRLRREVLAVLGE